MPAIERFTMPEEIHHVVDCRELGDPGKSKQYEQKQDEN